MQQGLPSCTIGAEARMKSRWVDSDALAARRSTGPSRHRQRPGAARLYDPPARPRSRPRAARRRQHLGEDPRADLVGEDTEVLCVKGSGWDMATIEPAGLPAVRLAPLRKLRALDALSRRRDGPHPARQPDRSAWRPIRRSRRCCMPSCRTLRRSHPRERGPEPRRPAERRGDLRRGL